MGRIPEPRQARRVPCGVREAQSRASSRLLPSNSATTDSDCRRPSRAAVPICWHLSTFAGHDGCPARRSEPPRSTVPSADRSRWSVAHEFRVTGPVAALGLGHSSVQLDLQAFDIVFKFGCAQGFVSNAEPIAIVRCLLDVAQVQPRNACLGLDWHREAARELVRQTSTSS